jgi:hypothetical protein
MGTLSFINVDAASWSSAPAGWNTVRTQVCADLVANLFPPAHDARITVNWGYNDVNGQALGGGAIGSSSWFISTDTYANFRTKYQAISSPNSIQSTAYANTSSGLPASNPFSGQSIYMPYALLKAIGIFGDFLSSPDFFVGFSSGATFDLTQHGDSCAGGTYSLYGVMMHELTEGLGRACNISQNATLYAGDLFSFSAASTRSFSGFSGRYASGDGGTTDIWDYNANSGADAGDLAQVGSSFDGFGTPGLAPSRSSTVPLLAKDWQLMTLLGWGLTSTGLANAGINPSFSVAGNSAVAFTGASTNAQAASVSGASSLSFIGRNASGAPSRLKLGHG